MNIDELIKNVYRKDYDALEAAIAAGANMDAVDRDGRTALMHAILASDADADMVSFLLRNGANARVVDKGQQWTALHFAARDQKLLMVRDLLQYGVEVDAQDVFGNTPLWRCVMAGPADLDLVRLLISNGADPSKKNKHGSSAFDVATAKGMLEVVELFAPA
jgi:ankyrin repeat protein